MPHICKIIDGRALAEKIKDGIVKEIALINKGEPLKKNEPIVAVKRPNLAIILIGSRDDSLLYVDMKEKEAKKVGIDTHIYKCPVDTPEKEIYEMIKHLNSDKLIDGILVQLPLPDGYDTNGIISAIDPEKDADLFHPENIKKMSATCNFDNFLPPVCATVLYMLESIEFSVEGKTARIVANSDIFGSTLAKVLDCKGISSEIIKPGDNNLKEKTLEADLLITAVGQPGLIKGAMIKQDAVVIDVGISKVGKKVKGDVDLEEAIEVASYISPVPGGVGPMTIAMLFRNTLELYKRHKIIKVK